MALLSGTIAALLWALAAKQGGDIYAKFRGEDDIWSLLGIEPSREEMKKIEKEGKKAEEEEFSRRIRKSHSDKLMDFAKSPIPSALDDVLLINSLKAMQRGSSIENILPAGMRPGVFLREMQRNEVDAWRKIRDAEASDAPMVQAAREGAAQPPPQGRLMQLAQGAGMVPGQGAQPGQQGMVPGA